jgi:hypothetical protein
MFRCIEDRKGHGKHGNNDEAATEVYTPQNKLRHPNPSFDLLWYF